MSEQQVLELDNLNESELEIDDPDLLDEFLTALDEAEIAYEVVDGESDDVAIVTWDSDDDDAVSKIAASLDIDLEIEDDDGEEEEEEEEE